MTFSLHLNKTQIKFLLSRISNNFKIKLKWICLTVSLKIIYRFLKRKQKVSIWHKVRIKINK